MAKKTKSEKGAKSEPAPAKPIIAGLEEAPSFAAAQMAKAAFDQAREAGAPDAPIKGRRYLRAMQRCLRELGLGPAH